MCRDGASTSDTVDDGSPRSPEHFKLSSTPGHDRRLNQQLAAEACHDPYVLASIRPVDPQAASAFVTQKTLTDFLSSDGGNFSRFLVANYSGQLAVARDNTTSTSNSNATAGTRSPNASCSYIYRRAQGDFVWLSYNCQTLLRDSAAVCERTNDPGQCTHRLHFVFLEHFRSCL